MSASASSRPCLDRSSSSALPSRPAPSPTRQADEAVYAQTVQFDSSDKPKASSKAWGYKDDELHDVKAERSRRSYGTNDNKRALSPSDKPSNLLLACPFYKSSRQNRHRHACEGFGFDTTPRVKEHIYRKHRIFQCPRCRVQFDSELKYQDHWRLDPPCELSTADVPGQMAGVNDDQVQQLKSRLGLRGLTEEQKWCQIYEIIFGRDTKVPSPFVDVDDYGELMEPTSRPYHFHPGFENALAQALEDVVGVTLPHILDGLRPQIPSIVGRCKERLRNASADSPSELDGGQPSVIGSISRSPPLYATGPSPTYNPPLGRFSDSLPINLRGEDNTGQIPTFARKSKSEPARTNRWNRSNSPYFPGQRSLLPSFDCPYCQEEGIRRVSFRRKADWKRHIDSKHAFAQQYKCHCGARFFRKDHVIQHGEGAHGSTWKSTDFYVTSQPMTLVLACGFTNCLKTFSSHEDWCNHVFSEMLEDPRPTWSFSWRVHNLLRQPEFFDTWKQASHEWSEKANTSADDLTWDPKTAKDAVKSLETHVYEGTKPELMLFLLSLGTVEKATISASAIPPISTVFKHEYSKKLSSAEKKHSAASSHGTKRTRVDDRVRPAYTYDDFDDHPEWPEGDEVFDPIDDFYYSLPVDLAPEMQREVPFDEPSFATDPVNPEVWLHHDPWPPSPTRQSESFDLLDFAVLGQVSRGE